MAVTMSKGTEAIVSCIVHIPAHPGRSCASGQAVIFYNYLERFPLQSDASSFATEYQSFHNQHDKDVQCAVHAMSGC